MHLYLVESGFVSTEIDKSWIKLSRTSVAYIHGEDNFLNYAFADGNQETKFYAIVEV